MSVLCVSVYMCAYIYMCLYVCVSVCVLYLCTCICLYVCVCTVNRQKFTVEKISRFAKTANIQHSKVFNRLNYNT